MIIEAYIGGAQRDFEVAASLIISVEDMHLVQSQWRSIAIHYA